jgi:serine/threonine-protein kinase
MSAASLSMTASASAAVGANIVAQRRSAILGMARIVAAFDLWIGIVAAMAETPPSAPTQPPGAGTPEVDVGTVLGETYEVTRMIGRGGMGAVYEARHLRLPGKRVAVKVLLGAAATDREAFARFRREAEIASQIGHPNIIEVLDFNVLPSGTPYLVLEFLDGEDLATRLARGKLSLEQTLYIVRQIGSALHAAHRADVVHRDLKPANIFLCPTDVGGELHDQVKVLDFGISKIRGSQTVQTQEATLLGTPQYMSPEQASGKNQELDQRTDVFSLGSIVYEMLAGEPAFSGGNLVALVFKVVYEANPSLAKTVPGLEARVVDAVTKAMAKDPAQRYQDVATFIADLTGREMQTLDRRPVPKPPVSGFAKTASATPVPTGSRPPSTAARGEIAPQPPEPATKRPGWMTPVAIGALLGAGAAVWGIIHVMSGSPSVAKSAPDLGHESVAVQPPPPQPPPTPPPVAVAPPDLATATAAPPVLAERPQVNTGHMPAPRVRTDRHEALPPEVLADLDEAERALAGGRTSDALHLARRTLNMQKSSRAFSIITRTYCKSGDLGNAKASFLSVGGSDRSSVSKACKAAGIDL